MYSEKKEIEKSLAKHKEEVVDELDVKKDSALKCEYSKKNGWYFEVSMVSLCN